MTRVTLVLLAFVVLFSACQKRSSSNLTRVYSTTYEYHDGKQIIGTVNPANGKIYYNIDTAGNKTVFQYTSSSDILNADDANYSATLTFQADSGVTSFTYTNEELQQHLTNYSSGGAWSYFGPFLINKGYIKGEKQGDTWKISVDVTLPEPDDAANNTGMSGTATYKKANW